MRTPHVGHETPIVPEDIDYDPIAYARWFESFARRHPELWDVLVDHATEEWAQVGLMARAILVRDLNAADRGRVAMGLIPDAWDGPPLRVVS